jgi:hypothetical protein
MVNIQVGPAEAVQVTVVVPFWKNEPDGGEQVTVPHVPVVVGAAYVTTAPHWLGSLDRVMGSGQVIVHGATGQVLQTAPSVTLTVSILQPTLDTELSVASRNRNLMVCPETFGPRLAIVVT